MKKLFFSILVVSLLSSTVAFADGRGARKNKKKTCPVECCSRECKKPPVCPPGSCEKK